MAKQQLFKSTGLLMTSCKNSQSDCHAEIPIGFADARKFSGNIKTNTITPPALVNLVNLVQLAIAITASAIVCYFIVKYTHFITTLNDLGLLVVPYFLLLIIFSVIVIFPVSYLGYRHGGRAFARTSCQCEKCKYAWYQWFAITPSSWGNINKETVISMWWTPQMKRSSLGPPNQDWSDIIFIKVHRISPQPYSPLPKLSSGDHVYQSSPSDPHAIPVYWDVTPSAIGVRFTRSSAATAKRIYITNKASNATPITYYRGD